MIKGRAFIAVLGAALVVALAACQGGEQKAASLSWQSCGGDSDTTEMTVIWRIMPRDKIRAEWEKRGGKERLGHKQINGFALFNNATVGKLVTIFTVFPDHINDRDTWNTICHEIKHGTKGHWHDAAGKEYRWVNND